MKNTKDLLHQHAISQGKTPDYMVGKNALNNTGAQNESLYTNTTH